MIRSPARPCGCPCTAIGSSQVALDGWMGPRSGHMMASWWEWRGGAFCPSQPCSIGQCTARSTPRPWDLACTLTMPCSDGSVSHGEPGFASLPPSCEVRNESAHSAAVDSNRSSSSSIKGCTKNWTNWELGCLTFRSSKPSESNCRQTSSACCKERNDICSKEKRYSNFSSCRTLQTINASAGYTISHPMSSDATVMHSCSGYRVTDTTTLFPLLLVSPLHSSS
mmetsp:Transcript_55906/g.124838  ORF Transcript_55906/g.124838 Transcript_55906/m.124838 type:complete len:224 (+) Transcript_55906:326-997(+)